MRKHLRVQSSSQIMVKLKKSYDASTVVSAKRCRKWPNTVFYAQSYLDTLKLEVFLFIILVYVHAYNG